MPTTPTVSSLPSPTGSSPRSASRTRGRVRRRRLAAVTGALCAVLAAATVAPGAARADAADPDGVVTPLFARGEAYLGATIPAYEGPETPGPRPSANPLASVEGVDVSSHQGNVDWPALWADGNRFAYVKATEGTYYRNEYFAQQYNGSYDVGMIRGAYHFGVPDSSSGVDQANFFVDNGGGWSADGKTLPGVLDIEYNPYGERCYGLSQAEMVAWIKDFTRTYKSRTGRDAVIYTTTDWWTQCTGNSPEFGSTNPLWIARWAASPGTLPAGWSFHTFWQYTSSGPIVSDHDRFNGSMDRLRVLATG